MSSSPLPSCIACPSRRLSGPPTAVVGSTLHASVLLTTRRPPWSGPNWRSRMRRTPRQPWRMRAHTHARYARNETRNNPARSMRPFCRMALSPRQYRYTERGGHRGVRGHGSHGTPRKPPQEDCHLLICRRASSRVRERPTRLVTAFKGNARLNIDYACKVLICRDVRYIRDTFLKKSYRYPRNILKDWNAREKEKWGIHWFLFDS